MNTLLSTALRWHYAAILAVCLLVTLPLELVLGVRVYRRPLRLVRTISSVALPFLALDAWAVHNHLWTFSPRHTFAVRVFGLLPVEEVLFFVVIPICALLTYGAVNTLLIHVSRRGRRL
jgi:lycopene beta-cyclase